mmetsp:Transcript_136691/g.291993  ORF Transcript_136691/g.291993 Transcript_136691/m.291993 type:complete len:226 (-) Transcript_136691:1212-1889(-)
MHGLCLQRVPIWQGPGQVAIDQLGDEGAHGCQQYRDVQQDFVERAERCQGLQGTVGATHPVTVQAHVPVREILEEVHQPGHDRVEPVHLQLLPDELNESVATSKDPLVGEVAASLDQRGVRAELLHSALIPESLQDEEAVGVVPRQEDILHHVSHALLLELQGLGPDHRRVAEVHSHRISTVGLDNVLGIRVVFQALAHLLAVRSQHQAVDDKILKRGLVEEVRG